MTFGIIQTLVFVHYPPLKYNVSGTGSIPVFRKTSTRLEFQNSFSLSVSAELAFSLTILFPDCFTFQI